MQLAFNLLLALLCLSSYAVEAFKLSATATVRQGPAAETGEADSDAPLGDESNPIVSGVTYTPLPAVPDDDQIGDDVENRVDAIYDAAREAYVADAGFHAAVGQAETQKYKSQIMRDHLRSEKVRTRMENN